MTDTTRAPEDERAFRALLLTCERCGKRRIDCCCPSDDRRDGGTWFVDARLALIEAALRADQPLPEPHPVQPDLRARDGKYLTEIAGWVETMDPGGAMAATLRRIGAYLQTTDSALLRLRANVEAWGTTYDNGQPRSRLATTRISRQVVLDMIDAALRAALIPPSATEPAGLRDRIEGLPITLGWPDGEAEERNEPMRVLVSKDAVLAALASPEPVEGPRP